MTAPLDTDIGPGSCSQGIHLVTRVIAGACHRPSDRSPHVRPSEGKSEVRTRGSLARRIDPRWLAVAGLVATGTLLAAAAPAGASSPGPQLIRTTAHSTGEPVNGTKVAVWGKTVNGKHFSFTYIQGHQLTQTENRYLAAFSANTYLSQAAADPNAVVAACEYHVVYFFAPGGSSGANNWQWQTTMHCTGNFGLQSQRTQLQRTSYRGWLGYSLWSDWTTYSGNSTVTLTWVDGCNHGAGSYDYRAAMQGRALNIGAGPSAYSGQINNINCGPSR